MLVDDALVVLDADMSEPELAPFAGGRVAVYSHRAPDKESGNEDGAALIPTGEASGLLAVTDGMGGGPAGEQASRIVLESLVDAAREAARDGGDVRAALLHAVDAANHRILDLGVGAATTLVVAEIRDGVVRSYHAGDSHLLVVGQRGKVKQFTVAHSPVGYAVEAGLLDAAEALHHEDRHLVSNIVGAADMRVEMGAPVRLSTRDTVLLGTDGLFDNLRLAEIVDLVRCGKLKPRLHRLCNVCHDRMLAPPVDAPSKPDDLTIVAFRPSGA